jgi:hypothetical protein
MSPAKGRQCGAMIAYDELAETDPSFLGNQVKINEFTTRAIETGEAQRVARRRIRIPIVVHVVYKRASENISKSQINSQITALNKDFRARNPDRSKVPPVWTGLVSDAKIEFELARRDPNGRPTDGVTRTKTDRDSFGIEGNPVKKRSEGGVAAWPRDRYLNVWVCTLADDLLGYAQFPGGPARTDGVVILNTAFGTTGTAKAPFNLGRTATHEVGHFLNLRHIWGRDALSCTDSDHVTDTPNQQGPNVGKPAFPHISCANGPHGDMFMNYMDYVDDAAMFMFSEGQVVRMNAALSGPRKKLAGL